MLRHKNHETDKHAGEQVYAQCVCCLSTDIVGACVVIDDGCAYQNVSCSECDAQWTDVYELVQQTCHDCTCKGQDKARYKRMVEEHGMHPDTVIVKCGSTYGTASVDEKEALREQTERNEEIDKALKNLAKKWNG
jgi:hypothetical protein